MCLQNNLSETNVVFADFDLLFFQLLRQKKEENLKKNKVIRILTSRTCFSRFRKNISLQFICFLNEFVQKNILKIPSKQR